MQRSEIRGHHQAEQRLFIPDFVSLHPGYGLANV